MNEIKGGVKVLFAICALVILEIAALIEGINGTMFSVVIALIAGLAGLSIPQPKILK